MYHVILDPLLHFQESNGLSRPGNKVYNGRKKKSQPSFQIVPEWYFLCQYAMLKAVPNKNAGFIILLTSIFTFFFFGEIRNLTTFTRLMDYNNGFSLSFFFNLFLSFLWIGAQFPQEKFLSYGRILTLDYYFLLMCILFAFLFFFVPFLHHRNLLRFTIH